MNMLKYAFFLLLLITTNSYCQSKNFLEVSGQWQRGDTLSCYPEVLTLGQDGYFVWLSEGDPCHIYTDFGKWTINRDTIVLTCLVNLHDEFGNGKYLKKYSKHSKKYVLLFDDNKLYISGIYISAGKSIKYIDYSKKTFNTNNDLNTVFFTKQDKRIY